ncbi:MAG: homocysteine S-methyltransferase family protein [Lentisphaerae bacterium]|nr:homocysteine S-methyltransferase family protein [Lentisphaerota bacterium]
MTTLKERVREDRVLICDGAMGTALQQRGLVAGECPELWCVERPADVKAVHRAYREAGSDIVECNSFGGTRYKLDAFGLGDRVAEINRAAAALAREVAGDNQYVLGSVGPTGQFMAPLGTATEADMLDAFREQIVALEAGGADAVIVETMTALDEALAAVRAAREHTALVVFVSFTFDPQQGGGYASMMGVRPEAFAAAALEAGADVIGANCGTGADHMIEVIRLLRAAAPQAPLIAMPNAGMPVLEHGETVFKETPEALAAKAPRLVEAGATIIGGCCGTGPEHIAAIRRAV